MYLALKKEIRQNIWDKSTNTYWRHCGARGALQLLSIFCFRKRVWCICIHCILHNTLNRAQVRIFKSNINVSAVKCLIIHTKWANNDYK